MPAVTRKMADLKDGIISKIDQKFNELKLEFLSELKDQIKKEVSEAIKTEIKKREELKSTVSLLQEHVKNFQKQVCILECKNEELGQYGRGCCLRIETSPLSSGGWENNRGLTPFTALLLCCCSGSWRVSLCCVTNFLCFSH